MAFERRDTDLVRLCGWYAEVRRLDGQDQAVVDLIGRLRSWERHTLVELPTGRATERGERAQITVYARTDANPAHIAHTIDRHLSIGARL